MFFFSNFESVCVCVCVCEPKIKVVLFVLIYFFVIYFCLVYRIPIQIIRAQSLAQLRRQYSNQRSAVLNEVVIVDAVRTPIGSFQSSLSSQSATQLGGVAVKGLLDRTGIAPNNVNEVYMGNVCSAGLGQVKKNLKTNLKTNL